MYYLYHHRKKYPNFKNQSGGSFGHNIPQFRAGELESSVYFLVARLQSATGMILELCIGRFLELSHRKIFL